MTSEVICHGSNVPLAHTFPFFSFFTIVVMPQARLAAKDKCMFLGVYIRGTDGTRVRSRFTERSHSRTSRINETKE